MKKIALILLILMFVGILPACRLTPVVEGDIPEDVPEDFAIHFEYWIVEKRKDIIDTYKGYIQKDLVKKGTKKKNYTIKGTELGEIYREVIKLKDIQQEMTSDNLAPDGNGIKPIPMAHYVIKFRADGVTYTIKGDDSAEFYTEGSPETATFWEV